MSETDTGTSAMLIDVAGGRVLARCEVENQIASDLLGFRESPFIQNQVSSAARQFSSWSMAACLVDGETDINSCVSSAYCWWEMP